MRVSNIIGNAGNPVRNQFILNGPNFVAFQSYRTIIVVQKNGKTYLDSSAWDYSRTTSKYRNIFLNETTKECIEKINSGEYTLVDNLGNTL